MVATDKALLELVDPASRVKGTQNGKVRVTTRDTQVRFGLVDAGE